MCCVVSRGAVIAQGCHIAAVSIGAVHVVVGLVLCVESIGELFQCTLAWIG